MLLQVIVRGSEYATEGPVLLETFVQYISHTDCRKMYSDGFLQRLTFDKFCADINLGNTNLDSNRSNESINFTVCRVFFCV